jgi:hypothetical protein
VAAAPIASLTAAALFETLNALTSPSRDRAPVASIDTELTALLAGLKPAMRVTAGVEQAEAIAARYRAQGLRVVFAAEPVQLGARATAILYVARREADAVRVRDAEALVLPGRSAPLAEGLPAHEAVGRWLGFPPCCVEAYCARVARGVDRLAAGGPGGLAEDYVAAREAWSPAPDPRLNHLLFAARIKLVSFYPCGYRCPTAIAYAQAVLDAIAKSAPADAPRLLAALSIPVAIAPSGARAWARLEGHTLASLEAPRDPSGRASDVDVALAASLAGATVDPMGAIGGTATPAVWLVPFGR